MVGVNGRSRYWGARLRHNARVLAVAAGVTALAYACGAGDPALVHRVSVATAYTSTLLLAWALVLGPWSVRRGRRPPTSTDQRRDVGIWSAVFGVVHTVVGLRVHLKGDIVAYFMHRADVTNALSPRVDAFGAANDTGLVAAVLLVLLTIVSNDRALRALGAARWKRVQRWTYAAAVLVAVHGLAYQAIERRAWGAIAVLVVLVGGVGALQLDGRRRYAAVAARIRVKDVR